ncbi:GNAT family N-acetyltransferase [Streptomyces sp. NBC_00654]|uniref:GNAT family N-acetyltransferase n=1 Tax=Streptomyces sp. NBC_00654 TaxID=2975799 RepID=UPI0022550213|nr:GNAT family protein [Streptomyces sp. NBC_00654]MCX4969690.1 GNAT family N-acetyltransferase [Streptomyces sp. NBC_00654]
MIHDSHPVAQDVTLRPAALTDAHSLAAVLVRNRAYMAPWEPIRTEAFYTPEGQAVRLTSMLVERNAGRSMPWVLADGEDRAIGAVTFNSIVRGPLRSAGLGYWVDADRAGQGLTTAAVRVVCDIARDELGLHRVSAGTALDNVASQRVLAKCGFEHIGTAPRYLHINGEWRDHRLFQRILHNDPPRD